MAKKNVGKIVSKVVGATLIGATAVAGLGGFGTMIASAIIKSEGLFKLATHSMLAGVFLGMCSFMKGFAENDDESFSIEA